MAAIVKANTNLSTGGLAVLKRSFQTSSRGQVTYNADYVCLAQFANTHAPKFRSKTQPPTALPLQLLQLNLNNTPILESLDTVSENGLTYFKAQYVAGIETDLIFTTTTEQRTASWRLIRRSDGNATVYSFDYMSITETVTGTNTTIPIVQGSTGRVFNARGVSVADIVANRVPRLVKKTIESVRQTRSQNGTYENSASSTGIYEAEDVYYGLSGQPETTQPSTEQQPTRRTSIFPDRNQYDPTSLTGRSGVWSVPESWRSLPNLGGYTYW